MPFNLGKARFNSQRSFRHYLNLMVVLFGSTKEPIFFFFLFLSARDALVVRAVDSHSAVTKVWAFYFDFLYWLQWVMVWLLWVAAI